jgi:hypothetical protein
VGVPRYKKQPKMGEKGPSGPSKIPAEAVPYTAAGGMKPRTDVQKSLDALKSLYENLIKPTGPAFDAKWDEMKAVEMPPMAAQGFNARQAYGGKLAQPWTQAALKKVGLGAEAIAASNWGSWLGGEELMKVAGGKASPLDALNLGLAYAPFGVGKLPKAAKSILPSIKVLKDILDSGK